MILPQVMLPNLDDIQLVLNRASQMVLEVSRGIHVWVNPRKRGLPENAAGGPDGMSYNLEIFSRSAAVTARSHQIFM